MEKYQNDETKKCPDPKKKNLRVAPIQEIDNNDNKCEICNNVFSTKHKLKNHIITSHDGGHKCYKCDSCGKSFSRTDGLMKHIRTVHEGHKDYKC